MFKKKNPRTVDFSNGCVDIFNFKKGEHSLMLYSYVYLQENTSSYYVSNFQSFLVWSLDYLYYYRTHARSKWEILQPSLDLTIAKKRLRKMQLGIILISQGGRIVFFDECSMYIFVEDFFLVEFVYFYELKNPWSKKEVEKKIVHENSCSKCSQKSYFWGYLFIFRATCLIKNPPFRLSIDL